LAALAQASRQIGWCHLDLPLLLQPTALPPPAAPLATATTAAKVRVPVGVVAGLLLLPPLLLLVLEEAAALQLRLRPRRRMVRDGRQKPALTRCTMTPPTHALGC